MSPVQNLSLTPSPQSRNAKRRRHGIKAARTIRPYRNIHAAAYLPTTISPSRPRSRETYNQPTYTSSAYLYDLSYIDMYILQMPKYGW